MTDASENLTPEKARQILEELARAVDPNEADAIPALPDVIRALAAPQGELTAELYRTLLEQIPAVTFMTSFEEGHQKVYVSPQIKAVLGYTQEEWLANPSLWYQRLHPEDKERWNEEFAATVISKGTAIRSVYRFLARDGRVVWILGDVRIRRDGQGLPLFVQAVGFDVTELERELAAKQREIVRLRSEVQKESTPEVLLLGSSAPMEKLRALLRKVAASEATLLVTGESGTGKELVARALHYGGPRARRPFVDVNCAAFTEGLPESELFGHEKGAFTGAATRHQGKFEQAHEGTLFLDEIGDMPLPIQAKILRVLQERSFERVGGTEKVRVDVRVICATNRDLDEAVRKGTFRQDLLYRINPLVIEVPPLRERASDIPELAEHFLARATRAEKRDVRDFSAAAMERLKAHAWPGNVRELQHAVQRAVLVCEGRSIEPEHLPPAVARRDTPAAAAEPGKERLIESLERLERSLIVAALDKEGWVKSRAARTLGLNERVLSYKMNNLGIEKS